MRLWKIKVDQNKEMQRRNFKETFCRLCLSTISDKNCQVIEEALRDVLGSVLPNVILEETNIHVMCNECSVKLFAAFNFKSICMDTDGIIFHYVNSNKVSTVDLKEVYLKEKGNISLADISENQRICRLCMQLVTYGFVSVNEVDVDIIDICISQVNFGAILDPVICGSCCDSLHTHSNFIKNCLDAQKKNNNIDKEPSIKTEETEIKLEDNLDVPEKYNHFDKHFYIKSEKIEIKVEEHDHCGDSSSYNLDNETIVNKQRYASEDLGKIKYECMPQCETGFNGNRNDQILRSEKSVCQNCDSSLGRLLHNCDKCNYETKLKTNLKGHELVHKHFSDVKTYKCDTCSYETKRKSNLKNHQLWHKDPSEIQMFKCDMCSYETKFKGNLKKHQLKHKNDSKTQMYKCDTCAHETKYKYGLKHHQLTHKDGLDVRIYKCDTCSFETKHNYNLKVHQLTHKNTSDIDMYKCDTCNFQTKFKSNIKLHQLKHKDSSEIQMHKCDVCSYETKYKNDLNKHLLSHKDVLEVEMYKCDACSYETKYKGRLKMHQLTHKDPSEIQMYKCDECSFETKHKYTLKRHQLLHKDPSEIKMWKCDTCSFETKYRSVLKKHQLQENRNK